MAKTSTNSSSDPLIQAITSRIMAESRAASNALADPYDPQYSINHWLEQYEDSCDSLYMSDEQKRQHIGAYLPKDAARWIRQSKTSSWADVKKKLLKTFGIASKEYKQLALKRLKSLRQGKTPIAQYALRFESALLEFPDGQAPDDDATRLIFFNSLNESTRLSVRPNICSLATWEDVSDAAIAIENAVPSADSLLEREFAKLSLEAAPSSPPSFGSSVSDPSPMEIDAFQRNRGNSSNSRFSGVSGAPRSQPRGKHPMRQWTKDGRPICGHCSTVGHLSKKCRARNGKSINQVGTVPIDDSTDSAPTVNTVRASTTPVQYAAIPIDDDPLAEPTGPMVNNVSLATSPAQGVSMVQDNVSTPRVRITLQGHLVQALVDTGANISAIRTSIANKLGVSPDVTKAAQFKIANNDNAASRGTVAIPTMIGPINTVLTYHVVDNLSHSAIVGYPQLKRLGAVIHTDTNVIRFPMESSPGLSGLSGLSGRVYRTSSRGSSGSAPLVCTMASHLRLPGQHHAYVDILGPPNSSVFVSTPFELAAEKLLTVASGVVGFDKNGIATVKLANLDNKLRHINKGQQIATYQYLSPSLKFYSLSPELTVNNVETTTTSCPVDFSPYIGQHLSHSEQTAMQELLQEFPDCFNSKPTTVTPLVKHTIDTGDSRPLSQPPHRASAAENETIDSLIDDNLKQGIIRPSNSPWSSPVVIVRKHDGSPRFCVDYRRLNAATTKDVYPLPRVDDTIHSLGQAKFFSTLDLTSSYWQIELDEEAKPKSAFICRSGLYEFVRMPFGLTNAPATMQRLMDSVLAGLKWQICLVYLDDIICYSPSFEQHLVDLRSVLLRLRAASLTANLKKCKFASNRISFLGYVITPDGLHTDPEKVRAVTDFPTPSNVEALRSFLGLAGYYRCFISKFSVLAAPLNDLLKKDVPWSWSDTQQQAYSSLQKALTSAPVLRFPDFSRPFELHTDGACTAGIGVILCQRDPRNNRAYAVAFASRSLSPAERNYGVSEVEALAIVWGIKKFAHYLTGTKFTVVTDHHSLQFLNKSKSTDLRGRLARWTLLLQQHDFEIVYRPGSKNAGPDALSRYPAPARVSANAYICSLQASDLASAQAVDPYCQELLRGPLPEGFSLESGILFFGPRPVLPASMQDEMFELLHSNPTSGHLGIGRTVQRFYRLYFFPGLKQWVTDKVNKCESCQRIKRDNKTLGYTKLVHTDPPAQPFDTIAIDTFGPLPISRAGNRYVIVIQCLFSRYVCLFAVPENNDVNVVNCLCKVIGEHGLFRVVMSDNGSPYSGTLLKSLAAHLNVQQRFCPAYHAESNGLVERFMETLKNMLSSYLQVNQNQNTWDTHLPEFQFAYNSTPHQATKYTPFSVEHGREARLLAAPDFGVKNVSPGDHYIKTKEFVNRAFDVIKLENMRSQASNALNFNGQRKAPTFALNDLVLVNCPVYSKASLGRSNKLSHRYRGPFRISEVLSSDRYNAVEISNGKVMKNIHASRLKKYNHNEDIAQCNNPDVVSV